MKKEIIHAYIKPVIVALLVITGVTILGKQGGKSVSLALCDATFTAACLVGGFGILRLAANAGTFDVVGYGIRHTFFTHYPGAGQEKEDMLTYKEKKELKRKPAAPPLLVGGLCLLASFVLLFICQKG